MKPARSSPKPRRSHQVREPTSCDLRSRYERALALARGYEAAGDRIAAERFFQQADHFRRLLNLKVVRPA